MTELPVDSLRAAAPLLRRPFTPEAVKWKPQTVLGKGGAGVLCVAYIDARVVIERLNHVCPHLWTATYRSVGDGLMWCDLTIDGVTRSDVGEGTGKALVSDALKRAAIHFGVGVSVKAIPHQKLWATDGGNLLSIWQAGSKPNGDPKFDARIEDPGHAKLRELYRAWLDVRGTMFGGEPLDHGDDADASGDETPAGVDPRTGEITEDPLLTEAQVQRVTAELVGIGMPDRADMLKRAGIVDQKQITLSQANALRGMLDALRAKDKDTVPA